jgi:hypothetical protein
LKQYQYSLQLQPHTKETTMNLTEVRNIAKQHGLTTGKHSKSELIKLVQSNEGNFDCYASASESECDQGGCSWRTDCFDAARSGEPLQA